MKASIVTQNGPAFFDRISIAKSPRTSGFGATSGMGTLSIPYSEHAGCRLDLDNVVEDELERRTALQLSRRRCERKGRQVGHLRQWKVQHQRVPDFRHSGCRCLLGGADDEHDADLTRRARVGIDG